MAKKSNATSRKPAKAKLLPDFHRQTVLFRWALGKLGVSDLDEFKKIYQISADTLAGLNPESGQHYFFESIANSLIVRAGETLSESKLSEYEQNILQHTQALNTSRVHHGQPFVAWKYYQYLTLLLTEIYFDHYFENADDLRNELNALIAEHNAEAIVEDQVWEFATNTAETAAEQLSKVAFWSATGSGKTLLMHINISQFRHYHKLAHNKGKWPELNQIILVTPNVGLTRQHIEELTWSGMHAVELAEETTPDLLTPLIRSAIKVIDIHKLITEQEVKARQEGGKRYSTSGIVTGQMQGCNLVLVDEGHRGAKNKSEKEEQRGWKARREQLASGGFTIEYSATFKEAAQGDDETRNYYARCILFDYAYRSFYRDGFGKDFSILNLEVDEQQNRYLTAALLLFYQQMLVWKDGGDAIKSYLIDKPLWVFVGHTVVGKASNADDRESISDVVEVLLFVKRFLADNGRAIDSIQGLLDEGFLDSNRKNLLAHRLPHIDSTGDKSQLARTVHAGILRDVFNAAGGGVLCVQLLKNADGELALKVGENDPFGVVNVGDPEGVASACEEHGVTCLEVDQNRDSLFHGINNDDSPVNLLVGSRKFTEGWNSWRVSSLGLMRMGKNEGTQIIQLFGRGVRLRGYRMCLRRSSVLNEKPTPPKNLRQVETLQVFGVKASYMSTFRDWIFSELPEAQEKQFWDLPIVQTLPSRKLKVLDLKETIEGEKVERGQAFRKLGPVVRLRAPHETNPDDDWIRSHRTRLNWLPRVKGITGQDRRITSEIGEQTQALPKRFNAYQKAVLDYQDLLFGLEEFKATRGLDRLHADVDSIRSLMETDHWYVLFAADEDMRCDLFENRVQWQRMSQQLLNNYAERFYRFVRGRWESPYIDVIEVDENHPNMMKDRVYQVETTSYAQTAEHIQQIRDYVVDLNNALEQDKLALWRQWTGNWRTVPFAGHLYQPLLHVGKNQQIKISPVPLDRHESQFVSDLAKWCSSNTGNEVYLLRNQSVTGLGFFQASNFFPDFLVWLHDEEHQYLAFADPKGLHNPDVSDPKLQFPTREVPRLQELVDRLDPTLRLAAFIISNTVYADLSKHKSDGEVMSKSDLEAMSVLFQYDDPGTYIGKMMESMVKTGMQIQDS